MWYKKSELVGTVGVVQEVRASRDSGCGTGSYLVWDSLALFGKWAELRQ